MAKRTRPAIRYTLPTGSTLITFCPDTPGQKQIPLATPAWADPEKEGHPVSRSRTAAYLWEKRRSITRTRGTIATGFAYRVKCPDSAIAKAEGR